MRFHIIFLILQIAPLLQAQTEAWQRINPRPVEISMNDLSLLPDNRIVAVGSNATILYSDNSGSDWEIIMRPGNIFRDVEFFSVDFSDAGHGMAVGSYFSILKTEDGGATWNDISMGAPYNYYDYSDVCFSNQSNCFISGGSTNCYLLHSPDGGSTWDTAFQTTGVNFDQVHFVDSTTGFLGGTNADFYFISEDGGQSWEMDTVQPPIEELHINEIHFINKNIGFIGASTGDMTGHGYTILKTVDAGKTWYQVFSDPFAGADKFFFLDQDTGYAISPIIWYDNSLLKTTDGGETWNLVSDHLGWWSFTGICMNDEGNGVIVGSAGQIYQSDDFGNSWEAAFVNAFPKTTINRSFITGDSSIVANLYGGTGGVMWTRAIESFDRGATWYGNESYPDEVSAIFFIDNSVAFYGGTPGGIYKSVDGGGEWVFHELDDPDFLPLSIDFVDAQTGFIGGIKESYYMELYKTTDQGETWTRINAEAFNHVYPFNQVDFINDSVGFIIGEINYNDTLSSFLISYDRGNTWEVDTLPFNNDFNGIYFVDDQTGFLYGWQKVCKTINGGQDWFRVEIDTEGYFDAISMSFPSSETGYLINGAMSNQTIFKTTDGGDNWYSLDPPTASAIYSVNFFTEDEGLILGENSLIFTTRTGGLVVLPEPEPNPLRESIWTCYPNPFSSQTTILAKADMPDEILIRIFDFTGRTISHHSISSAKAGETVFSWNGKDDQGNMVPEGIYMICIDHKSSRETLKIIKF